MQSISARESWAAAYQRSLWPIARLLLLFSGTGNNAYGQQVTPAVPAQTAEVAPAALVTFYSNAMSFAGGMPKQKGAAFRGRLFADKDQVAFLEPDRFITISFTPARYDFTLGTWMATAPVGSDHLALDLVSGHHYFVEAASRNLMVPSLFTIKEVACEEAARRNANAKPLEGKHLSQEAAANVVKEPTFPSCPSHP